MKRQLLLGVFGLALSLTVAGCGSDGGGTSTTAAAVQTSCNSYCTALIAKACALPIYASLAECMSMDCAPVAAAPAKCNAALKTYYDCRAVQTDICEDSGCDTQAAAILTCAG